MYRNWANWILKGAGIDVTIEDFCKDLADGTILNRMVEAFSGRQQRYTKVCANDFQKIDNINLALAWFKRKGLITTVASQDFVSGNIRPVLGFFWMLIQKYQLVSNQSMSFTPEDDQGSIYDWVAKYVRDYPAMGDVKLSSPQEFRDGKILSYMVHKNVPDSIPLEKLNGEAPQNRLDRAIDEAYDKLGVPMLMESSDLLEANPHEPTLLTYLYAFRATVENEKHLAKRRDQMDQAARERATLLGKAAQADELAADASRQREELERERQRLQEEEARRRAEEEERRRLADEERDRLERDREGELAKLRKERFDMLQAQRQAEADRKAREDEAERMRQELDALKKLQAERDQALKDLAESEAQRKRDQEERDRLEKEREAAERARREAERSASNADADQKRAWAELERERDEANRKLREAQEAEEARRRELADARRAAEAEAERMRREADDARKRQEAEEAARREAERRAREEADEAAERERALRKQMELLRSQATPAEQGQDCAGCHRKLNGQVVRLNGSTLYHERCFTCATCDSVFDSFYYPHSGLNYCAQHVPNMKCGKCRDAIVDDKVVMAKGQAYHSRCFVCSDCGDQFTSVYHMRSGQPVCDRHASIKA